MTPYSRGPWSLYDMLKFYAASFVRASVRLERVNRVMAQIEGWEPIVEADLVVVKKECERIGFRHMANECQRIIDLLRVIHPELAERTKNRVSVLLEELARNIDHKLQGCLFLRVDTNRMELYSEEDSPHFGEKVAKSFPRSTYHIAEAGRCFALERWDASAYHLILASEEALRKWACALKVKTNGKSLAFMDWKPILDAARTKLDSLRSTAGKTQRGVLKVERLAEQLSHFGLIKDAYRNACAHGRHSYDERKARNLMNQIRSFMESLA